MADANIPTRPGPADWSEAFAMLPPERAPDGAWLRLAAALPATPARPTPSAPPRARRGVLRAGLAAAASVAFALPMAWWLASSPGEPTRATARPVAPPSTTALSGGAPTARPATPAAGADLATQASNAASPRYPEAGAHAAATATAAMPGLAAADHTIRQRQGRRRPLTNAPPAHPRVEAAVLASAAVAPAMTPAPDPALAALRDESARLEALVAYARDERMASAPAAVMSAAIDDRIRLIDGALTQPGLDEPTRASLWSERVDALRTLASLEGTQRWMAAHGASMQAVARVD